MQGEFRLKMKPFYCDHNDLRARAHFQPAIKFCCVQYVRLIIRRGCP